MEPRSFKRGNIFPCHPGAEPSERFNGATFIQTWKLSLCRKRQVLPQSLQWSHVHSNVETRAWDLHAAICSALQWSHVHSNVETRRNCDRYSHGDGCFNGATFIQTWKHQCDSRSSGRYAGFNGATFIQTWKPPSKSGRWNDPVSFNVATFIQTWKQALRNAGERQ